MKEVNVKTQAELDAALAAGDNPICIGRGDFSASGSSTVHAYGSATVHAYGSATVIASDSATVRAYGSATVRAYGSATVHAYGSATVRAYGSATVHAYGSATVIASDSATVRAYGSATVRAYGSATVHAYDSATVRAYGSATVSAYGSATVSASDSATVRAYGSATVRAYGSATVHAYGSATVIASKFVGVTNHGPKTKIVGGRVITIKRAKTVEQWCEFYGIEIKGGKVVLFKALSDSYKSNRDFDYTAGTTPTAPDWDGGEKECRGGLHFSPHPFMALEFFPEATKFAACPILVKDIAIHPDGQYPQKVKAKGCCAPIWECDIEGNKI